MGFNYILIGFFFFFLPNLSIIDIFPDFIGCIFIIYGLKKLSDIFPALEDARKAFFRSLYVFITKFILMFTIPFFSNGVNDGGYILIFSFTFAVCELIFVLPAFKALLNGMTYLGDRTNSKSVFCDQKELSVLTSVFLIVRGFLSFIPDFSYISNPKYSQDISEDAFYFSDYRVFLIVINLIVTTLIGAVWISYAYKYFKRINADKCLSFHTQEKYNEFVTNNKGIFIKRGIKFAFTVICIGAVFMHDLLIDYVNVLPDFIAVALFLWAALLLKKYINTKHLVYSSIFSMIISMISWGISVYYAVKFTDVNIWSNFEAYDLYIIVCIFNTFKYLILSTVFYSIYKTIDSVVTIHTGSASDELESIASFRNNEKIFFKKHNLFCLILGLITVLTGILRMFLLYDFTEFWLIDLGFTIIWLISLYKLLGNIINAVEYKYF